MAKTTVQELEVTSTGDVIILLPVTNVTQVQGLVARPANETLLVVFQPVS